VRPPPSPRLVRGWSVRLYKTTRMPPTPSSHTRAPARPPAQVRVARVQEGDELILACDGLWDVLSPEAAFEYLHDKKVGAQLTRARTRARARTRTRTRTLAFE
jgi:hypothetical protein